MSEDGPVEQDRAEQEPAPPAYERFDCTSSDADVLAEATEAARLAVEAGRCIVLPTDTVYGIGADAFSADAVQGLLDAKNRGRDMPPPVLIGDASLIRALATDVPDAARDLVAAHWPGALTIICRIQPSLRMDLGETDGTIALRVPDHDLAREILRRTGPMAVSSANLSGQPAALTCDDAVEQLGDKVAVYLDGGGLGTHDGEQRLSPPSTIVDFTTYDDGEVLRRGALDLATLRETVPGLRDLAAPDDAPDDQPDEKRVEPAGTRTGSTAVPFPDGEPDEEPELESAVFDDVAVDDTYDPDADPDQPDLFDEHPPRGAGR